MERSTDAVDLARISKRREELLTDAQREVFARMGVEYGLSEFGQREANQAADSRLRAGLTEEERASWGRLQAALNAAGESIVGVLTDQRLTLGHWAARLGICGATDEELREKVLAYLVAEHGLSSRDAGRMTWGQWADILRDDCEGEEGQPEAVGVTGDRRTCNDLMLSQFTRDRRCVDWSLSVWAKIIGFSKSTIQEQPTWTAILKEREQLRREKGERRERI